MQDFRVFFKDKKVTIMGLGLLGRGVGDALFLAECGAELTITDLKTKMQLKESLQKLKKFQNIKYTLGGHKLEDFRNKDFILKSAGVLLDSPYIKEAKKNKIPVEMSAAFFAKLSGVPMIGVTGTRGKSTVTHLIAHILKFAGKKVILGGNVRGVSNLQLLKEIKNAEFAVFELDSWQLQGFGEVKISPHISVFTNFLFDHLNYYGSTTLTTSQAMKRYFADKSYIYKFQNRGDVLVLGPKLKNLIKNAKGKIIYTKSENVPKSWHINLLGKHNVENVACALGVARVLSIPDDVIKKAVESFQPVSGRLEMVKVVRGVQIYNDTNSTTPDAVIAALNSFTKKVILIMGGMDKGLKVDNLVKVLSIKTKYIFLTPGSGSDKIKHQKVQIEKVSGLKEAIMQAMKKGKTGDIVLFSPGFASFNMFNNEYDRGDQFMKIVKNLK